MMNKIAACMLNTRISYIVIVGDAGAGHALACAVYSMFSYSNGNVACAQNDGGS